MSTRWIRRTPAWRWLCAAAILMFLPVVAPPVPAQDSDSMETYDVVPARLRALSGDVLLQRAREQDRVVATLNLPVYPGDLLRSEHGRAEIQLPDGSLAWIDEETSLEVLSLFDPYRDGGDGAFLSLREGTVEIEYRPSAEGDVGEFRIDTREGSALLLKPGRYRLDARDGTTTLTTYRGLAELAGDDGSVWVRSGQRTRAELARGPDRPWAVNTLRRDDFDVWCEERLEAYLAEFDPGDSREYVEELPRPVRHYVSELDAYGDWVRLVEFGWVWRPTVYQIGWRPYFNGYWTWCPGGWSWVAYEPWGWYPYHYGRWHWVTAAGWVWIPGGVYSGAWVSWAVTPGYIGWAPLDFYNRPVYLRTHVTSGVASRYGDAWHFLPSSRFGDRSIGRSILKSGRVPALQGAVTTRSLPRFSPSELRDRPETGQRLVREVQRTTPRQLERPEAAGRDRIPFRVSDRREVARERAPARRPAEREPRIQRPSHPERQRLTAPRDGAARVPQNRGARPSGTPGEGQADRQRQTPRRDVSVPPAQRPAPQRSTPPERARPARPEGQRPQARPETGKVEDPSREVLRRIFRERPSAPATPEGRTVSPGQDDARRKRPQEARPARPSPPSRQEVSRSRPPARPRESPPPRERSGKEKPKPKKKDDGR